MRMPIIARISIGGAPRRCFSKISFYPDHHRPRSGQVLHPGLVEAGLPHPSHAVGGSVSKGDEQNNVLETKVLRVAGCRKLFDKAASGGRWDRPKPHRMLDQLREGDTVAVWTFEHAVIRERTSAGVAAACADGRIGGQRKKLDLGKRREITESVIAGH